MTMISVCLFSVFQVEESQEALQTRINATAIEVRAFARGYANAVEAHCLSLLQRLEELHLQSRCGRTRHLCVKFQMNFNH